MARTRIETIDALDALPSQAAIYDHDNRIWQKLWLCGPVPGWATPGVAGAFPVDDVALPAWLLDDGL